MNACVSHHDSVLVLSRICHAAGLKSDTRTDLGRLIGAAGSALLMMVASVWAIITYCLRCV